MDKLDNMHLWKVFVHLAGSLNFQVTSDFFEEDTSTISRNISSFEKALGRKLFFRKKGHLQLTENGETAYRKMKPHIEMHQKIIVELQKENSDVSGEIRLSVAQGLSAMHAIDLFSEFQSFYPYVTFKLAGHGSLEDLENNIADVACITGEFQAPNIFLLPKGRIFYAPIASPEYVEKYGFPLEPEDLKNHNIFEYDGENRKSTRVLYKNNFSKEVLSEKFVQVSDILTIKRAVLRGKGLCLDMPLPLCKKELEDGKLIRVLPGWSAPSQPSFIAMHLNHLSSRRFRIFAHWLKQKLLEIET